VITDPVPRGARQRKIHADSDVLTTLPLPPAPPVQASVQVLQQAMGDGQIPPVRRACAELLE
jgi:hypothetical protein